MYCLPSYSDRIYILYCIIKNWHSKKIKNKDRKSNSCYGKIDINFLYMLDNTNHWYVVYLYQDI